MAATFSAAESGRSGSSEGFDAGFAGCGLADGAEPADRARMAAILSAAESGRSPVADSCLVGLAEGGSEGFGCGARDEVTDSGWTFRTRARISETLGRSAKAGAPGQGQGGSKKMTSGGMVRRGAGLLKHCDRQTPPVQGVDSFGGGRLPRRDPFLPEIPFFPVDPDLG